MVLEVEPNQTIEDVIVLVSVQKSDLDFDQMQLYFNGEKLNKNRTLMHYRIQDDYQLQLRLEQGSSCCSIL